MADTNAASTPLGRLTAAFEQSGSPYWLMDCIQQEGLDRRHGFELQIRYGDDRWRGNRHATEAALVDGEVDFIDCDWLTLLRCRAEGAAISAVYPYGRILGGLVVPADSPATELADLRGGRIGVVNAQDKNWILLKTYAREVLQLDLDQEVALCEAGSKTTLASWLEEARVDAALVYWHQIPKLTHGGHRLLVDIPLLLPALGTAPTPTTFFLFRDQLIEQQPQLVQAFINAFEDARRLLAGEPDRWHRIGHELLALKDVDLITQLRQTWRSRIDQPWTLSQLEGLWPLTQSLFGGEAEQFQQAFAWQFLQPTAP